jgi:HSP20 family protein
MATQGERHPSESKSPVDRTEHGHAEAGNWFVPAVDVYESDDALTILADMPGVKQEGLELVLEENELVVTGRCEGPPEGEDVIRREYETGNFHRHFAVYGIDEENVSAELENGVLKVVLPKKAQHKPRRIPVQ